MHFSRYIFGSFCCHVFVTMHRYKTSMHLYYTINMHTSTDISAQMQTHNYKCCHSHTYTCTTHTHTLIHTKNAIYQEKCAWELLLFSFTPSFSFSILYYLKYLLIYFLLWDGCFDVPLLILVDSIAFQLKTQCHVYSA